MTNASSPPLIGVDPASCLGSDDIVESAHPEIVALAHTLRSTASSATGFAAAAFEWVRDEVSHSFDAQDPRVTLTASEVLEQRAGLCYAKSHLLAALLRAQDVPTALCYQLLHDANNGGFVLHGLVAVHLDGAWHRQDPRGNKQGVDAQFSLGEERLAWEVDPALGERDDPRLFAAPARSVVGVLRTADNVLDLYSHGLPRTLPEGPEKSLPTRNGIHTSRSE